MTSNERDERTPQQQEIETVEPERSLADPGVQGEPQPEQDPVTARNDDPAAASEHERNAQIARDYGVI